MAVLIDRRWKAIHIQFLYILSVSYRRTT